MPDWSATEWTFLRGDHHNGRHDVRGYYVDHFWTPVLGPSAVAILRWFARPLREQEGVNVATDVLPGLFGIRRSIFERTLQRIAYYHFAEAKGPRTVVLRTYLPSLPHSALQKLHPYLIEDHAQFLKKEPS